jgi:ATP-dependent RecD-like DNA helicase SH3 domain
MSDERGSIGSRELNERLQAALNPLRPGEIEVERFGFRFRQKDKVIQTENNYDKEVFNGDIGQVDSINATERELVIRYETRLVTYDYGELDEVSLTPSVSTNRKAQNFRCCDPASNAAVHAARTQSRLYRNHTREEAGGAGGRSESTSRRDPKEQHSRPPFRTARSTTAIQG